MKPYDPYEMLHYGIFHQGALFAMIKKIIFGSMSLQMSTTSITDIALRERTVT